MAYKRIGNLEKHLQLVNQRKTTLKDVENYVKENYPQDRAKLIITQLLLSGKSPRSIRYDNELKQLALVLYILSPKAYRNLSKVMTLPSKSTILRITQNWDITVGFTEFIFNSIELKVNAMIDIAKDCVICLDEMSIKSNLFYNLSKDSIIGFCENHTGKSCDIATHALVVMARGIAVRWKQPIAYFFVKSTISVNDIKDILFEAVRKLNGIGLRVRATVSDQGSTFYNLVKVKLGVTIKNPFFFVDGKKVFYIFDVPHLLKSTKNNFFSYQFVTAKGTTNKMYLEQMYEIDSKTLNQCRLAPKLSNEHLYPTNFQKMKVRYAAQIFSHSVHTAMSAFIALQLLPSTAAATADFIEKMNLLFDVMNSCSLSNYKGFMGTENQVSILNEMDTLFKNLVIKNSYGKNMTNTMKFIFGWRLSISSIKLLFEDLRVGNYKFLLTRNLNQDCLENFFGQIRNACGNAKNPTAIQFVRAFKKLYTVNLMQYSDGANCLEDYNDLLTTITSEYAIKYNFLLTPTNVFNPLKVDTTDYNQLDLFQENSIAYVAGYLLKKCLDKKHSCQICIQYANYKSNMDERTIFTHLKAFKNKNGSTFGGLKTGPDDFIFYVIKLEEVFRDHFVDLLILPNIGSNLKYQFKKIDFTHPCPNFPLDYLIALYTRVKLYFTVKFANREIKTQKSNKAPVKLVILKNL